jgi:hypothetical protein
MFSTNCISHLLPGGQQETADYINALGVRGTFILEYKF